MLVDWSNYPDPHFGVTHTRTFHGACAFAERLAYTIRSAQNQHNNIDPSSFVHSLNPLHRIPVLAVHLGQLHSVPSSTLFHFSSAESWSAMAPGALRRSLDHSRSFAHIPSCGRSSKQSGPRAADYLLLHEPAHVTGTGSKPPSRMQHNSVGVPFFFPTGLETSTTIIHSRGRPWRSPGDPCGGAPSSATDPLILAPSHRSMPTCSW